MIGRRKLSEVTCEQRPERSKPHTYLRRENPRPKEVQGQRPELEMGGWGAGGGRGRVVVTRKKATLATQSEKEKKIGESGRAQVTQNPKRHPKNFEFHQR